ncbi:hypothetical protein L1077_24120 [Pseudoalteromonas luteoviolacea]|uniref:hypothetical protein n=1 Tax=Pseudoalteromonas luteoviolacea TaxID=43657 RepID=UPI001F280D26|nr:hypothetical protein [Pseudoalteromonas luteoviolacea]MCF6442519.1 hypothetical protein [Pseudoalteromonas luteoviolacea]
MDNNEFEQLSSLWQSTDKKPMPQMDKVLKRHKRQGVILRLNLCIEMLALIVLTYLLITSALNNGLEFIKLTWISFVTVWAVIIFILASRSRLDSLKQLKSQEISTSIEIHKKLIKNEIYRWNLNIKATWAFILIFMVFNIALIYQNGFELNNLLTEAVLMAGLFISIFFFVIKNKKAKEILHTLEQ